MKGMSSYIATQLFLDMFYVIQFQRMELAVYMQLTVIIQPSNLPMRLLPISRPALPASL